MKPPQINPRLTLLPQKQGPMSLLQNPLFGAGMGLLSAGYDSRINPYQAAMSGMSQAQQIKWLDEKRKEEQRAAAERAKLLAMANDRQERTKVAGEGLIGGIRQGAGQTPITTLDANNNAVSGWEGGRPLNQSEQIMGSLAQAGELGGAANLYANLQRNTDPTTSQKDWAFAQTLSPEDQAKFLGGDRPSSIKEWEYFSSLTPEQQQTYLTMKRASQVIATGGGGQGQVNPLTSTVTDVVTPEAATGREAILAEEKAKSGAIGKAQGEARTKLEPYRIEAKATTDFIDLLRNHPGKESALGPGSLLNKTVIPGSTRADFLSQLETLSGKQFSIAYETLRGGGTITEVETSEAKRALGNMETAQSVESFDSALDLFEDAVTRGYKKLEAQTGLSREELDRLKPPESLRRRRYNPATGKIE